MPRWNHRKKTQKKIEIKAINDMDIALAAELALPHRINKTPFSQADMTPSQLQERIEEFREQVAEEEGELQENAEGESGQEKKT